MKSVQLNTHNLHAVSTNLWTDMLAFFLQSGLRYNSSPTAYVKSASSFLTEKKLDESKAEEILTVNSVIDADFFIYPDEVDNAEKFDFELGFDNFFVTLKDELNNESTIDNVFLGSERQAIPPQKADEAVGHNGDVKEYQSNYSYLFDRI